MDKEEAANIAKLLVAIDAADPNQTVVFKKTNRRVENLEVCLPALWEKDQELNRKILELGSYPSRYFGSEKSNKKTKLKIQHILVYLSNIESIDIKDLETKVREFTAAEHTHTAAEWAHLVLHVYRTWNKLPGDLKQHRKVTVDMVKGYMKQRQSYRHHEIIEALITYGKWAEAYRLAMAAEEDEKIFWFHRWDLDSLLRSNKAMNHVGDGWFELVKAKRIPMDYAKKEDQGLSPSVLKGNVDKIVKDYMQWEEFGVDDQNFMRKHPEVREAVDAEIERLKNAS